jgi:hypothetical protein
MDDGTRRDRYVEVAGSEYPSANATPRTPVAAQLLRLAETVGGTSEKMALTIREKLEPIMRPEKVESAKLGPADMDVEEWPPLFAELRRQLERIDHHLGVIALDLMRVEL